MASARTVLHGKIAAHLAVHIFVILCNTLACESSERLGLFDNVSPLRWFELETRAKKNRKTVENCCEIETFNKQLPLLSGRHFFDTWPSVAVDQNSWRAGQSKRRWFVVGMGVENMDEKYENGNGPKKKRFERNELGHVQHVDSQNYSSQFQVVPNKWRC